MKMSSRKIFLCGVLLFALKFTSPAASGGACRYTRYLLFSSDCTELRLSNKNLESFNLSTFTFTNLKKIFLNFNKLTEMPRLPASVKATLKWLVLSYNKIASIQVDYFNDFRSLTRIYLRYNKLTEMPPLPVSVKATLLWLVLSRNKIASVMEDYFNDFRSLTKLDLEDNELTEMPEITDSVKSKLLWFRFSGNKISVIPAGYFSGFSELSVLSLHGNIIRGLPAGTALEHLSKLRDLRIDQMDCDDCATLRVWYQIGEMNKLHLRIYQHGNRIGDFPCAGDLSSKALKELRASTCTCHYPSPPRFSPDCTMLDIRYNELESLDLSSSTFTNLKRIYLNYNKLTELPRLSASVKATLQELILDGNEFSSIQVDSFNDFRNLTHILLSYNMLTEMPPLPASVKATLQHLVLISNKIASIQLVDYFIGFQSLTRIYLRGNELTEMPTLPVSVKATLQELMLGRNKIASIQVDYFNDFQSLTDISLQNNELTETPAIPDSVKSKLIWLRLSSNKISEIPAGYFTGLSELLYLWLHCNNIRNFPAGTSLTHVSELRELVIDQMDCDCATLQFWQKFEAMNIRYLRIYKDRQFLTGDFPCYGDLSRKTLQELRGTTCSK